MQDGETGLSICLGFLSFLPLLFRSRLLPERPLKLPHVIGERIKAGKWGCGAFKSEEGRWEEEDWGRSFNWCSTAVIGNLIGMKGSVSLGSGGITDKHKVMIGTNEGRPMTTEGQERREWRRQDIIHSEPRLLICSDRVTKGKPGCDGGIPSCLPVKRS